MTGNPEGLTLFRMMDAILRDLNEQIMINETLKTAKFRDRVIELLNQSIQVHPFQTIEKIEMLAFMVQTFSWIWMLCSGCKSTMNPK